MAMVFSMELLRTMQELELVEGKIIVFITIRSIKQMLLGVTLRDGILAMVPAVVEVRGTTLAIPLLGWNQRKRREG
jgi:hypothetical protein